LISVLEAFGSISSDGIALYNLRAKRIEYVNNALVNLFDISHESFAHQPEFFVNHILETDLELLKHQFEILVSENRIENVEFSTKSHDGTLKNVSASCYIIEKRKFLVGMFRDITRTREHENYIINYGAKKNTLLDMVTHNLSGPLAISKNLLESLDNVVHINDIKNIHAHIHLVKENTRHCIEILNDFLEEEHMVSQNISVKKNRFELFEKINAVVERFQKSYPDFKFTMTSNIATLNISQDDVKFLQALNNLISNAIKWSHTKSQIEIRVIDAQDFVNISIVDTGVGIPEHMQRFLFDKNTKASREGLRGEKSIGMGLYIVRRLVRIMDGDLTFESIEGKGSTFTMILPKEDLVENGSHPATPGAYATRIKKEAD
jgi:two-component system sensor histidine kinase VicK